MVFLFLLFDPVKCSSPQQGVLLLNSKLISFLCLMCAGQKATLIKDFVHKDFLSSLDFVIKRRPNATVKQLLENKLPDFFCFLIEKQRKEAQQLLSVILNNSLYPLVPAELLALFDGNPKTPFYYAIKQHDMYMLAQLLFHGAPLENESFETKEQIYNLGYPRTFSKLGKSKRQPQRHTANLVDLGFLSAKKFHPINNHAASLVK